MRTILQMHAVKAFGGDKRSVTREDFWEGVAEICERMDLMIKKLDDLDTTRQEVLETQENLLCLQDILEEREKETR